MKYSGLLVKEGLQDTKVLELLDITKTELWDVANAEGDQPKKWTAISFDIVTDNIDEIATKLSLSLKPMWYLNFSGDNVFFVVFLNKVLSYEKGDTVKKTEAMDYARSVGIPESQLDWKE